MSAVGDMLRLARQRKGFTQRYASERLGIVQPVLSRYENGISDPDDALLLKAAQVYEVPAEFFQIKETVYGPPVSVHPMTRAKADVTGRELDMVTAELNVRVMQIRRFLEGVDFDPSRSLPFLDVEENGSPERIAGIVRAHWGIGSGPLKNLTGYVESAGIIVGMSDFSGSSISGITFKVPGQPPLVLLNKNHPSDRLRFTLAHELGHIVMHRFPTPAMEDEANHFASALLMPERDIRAAFAGRKITLQVLASLKPEWKVAMQALLVRVKSLNIIDNNQARYLWQQISARGWRLREPPELDFPQEDPSVLRSMIKAHLSVLGYSLAELSKIVPLREEDFVSMYGLDVDAPAKRATPKLRIVS
ncbi:MAG TPA: XRE family transcriptional regulator [Hyphomicrobium sp.]|nr:XRE family transcriptional regulator [Hyphomicrobium sp.]